MRQVLVYRPDHPKASKFGNVDIRELDAREADLAVNGPKHVQIVGDSHYDGVQSPVDGSDISSRRKRREHMKQHGLADYDDFKGVWAKEKQERDQRQSGHFDTKERKEAIEKAFYQVTEKGYKPDAPHAEITQDLSTPLLDVNVLPDNTVVKLKEHE